MGELIQWTIYENPSDYPGKWVVRKFTITPGKISSGPAYICESLEDARAHVPDSFYNLGRQPGDSNSIWEVWT